MGWVNTPSRCLTGVSRQPREKHGNIIAFDRREPLAPLRPSVLRVQQSRHDTYHNYNAPQARVRRLRFPALSMLSQVAVEEAENVGKQLGMGSCQTRLHVFDDGDEALFEILKGDVIEWACYPPR